MPRINAMDAIRIEDEVWQEAFARREPGQLRTKRRLQAVDGGRTSSTLEPHASAVDRTAEPTEVPGAASSGAGPARRTVIIRGRGAEVHPPRPDASRRRPQRRAYERAGFRPDRVAMWAVVLGFVLVLAAILSAH